MDFTYSEEQQMLADGLRRFVAKRYSFAQRRAIARTLSGFDRTIWRDLAELGVLGLNVPEAYGGFGADAASQLVAHKELGRALVLEPVIPSAVCASAVLARFGSAAQQAQWLPALADGSKIATLAWQEPGSRYRPETVAATATPTGDGYVLAGVKALVWHGAVADVLLVSARVGDGGPLALFLLERQTPGVDVRAWPTVDGQSVASVTVSNAALPGAALIGAAGDALAALEHAFEHGIAALCAQMAGAMERLIELTSEYLGVRRQFGAPLASFQALQHRVAEMLIQKELALSMACMAAQALGQTDPAQRARMFAAAKLTLASAGRFVGEQAVQLHGGMGMTDELEIGDYFKRLTMADTLFGDSDTYMERYCAAMED